MTEGEVFDHYWESVGEEQELVLVRKNIHFDNLNAYLRNNINSVCILEDNVPCEYREQKKWDIHFPDKKIAVEYKTVTAKSILKCKYLRIEEALGSSIDVKTKDPEYKLGFVILFAFNLNDYLSNSVGNLYKWRDWMVSTFNRLVEDGYYDFLCIIQTNGVGDHEALGDFGLNSFIQQINQAKGGYYSSLDHFLTEGEFK